MKNSTNAETFRQYKSRFSLIVEQLVALTSSSNLVREVKKSNHITMFCVIDNSHLDR